jgi:hypothetical protein
MTTTLTKTRPPSLQYSGRLKLTDEQRDQLRRSFNEKLNEGSPEVRGTGGIRVQTAHATSVEASIGMDRITFSSLIGSRESIALPVILRLQRELGVELVTEDSLKASFDSYVAYLRETYWN